MGTGRTPRESDPPTAAPNGGNVSRNRGDHRDPTADRAVRRMDGPDATPDAPTPGSPAFRRAMDAARAARTARAYDIVRAIADDPYAGATARAMARAAVDAADDATVRRIASADARDARMARMRAESM